MSIFVESRRVGKSRLEQKYENCKIIDVTSKSSSDYIKLSPFYPHGDIPVPFTEKTFSESVEGIWQGLKVFENEDIDTSKFLINNMRGIKRSSKRLGNIIGHRNGVYGSEIMGYVDAKKSIYVPTYYWVLENFCQHLIAEIKSISANANVILLDYNLNNAPTSNNKPISHAFLCKLFIEGSQEVIQYRL